jgi:uncharacterized protein YggE
MTHIQVSGTGAARAVPDYATLSFRSQAEAATPAQALELVATRAVAVQQVLDGLGTPRQDRGNQHTSVHRQTRWEDGAEVTLGWQGMMTTECTVREVSEAFGVLEAVATLDDVAATGPDWQISPDNPAHAEAREAAVAAARAKAEDYARAAGLTLGRLVRLSDAAPMTGPVRAAPMRAAAAEVLDPEHREVTATVTMEWETLDGA